MRATTGPQPGSSRDWSSPMHRFARRTRVDKGAGSAKRAESGGPSPIRSRAPGRVGATKVIVRRRRARVVQLHRSSGQLTITVGLTGENTSQRALAPTF